MNLILVLLENFQEYIIYNIRQLIKLKIDKIYVITNMCFFEKFLEFKNNIILINVNEIDDSYNYFNKSKLDKKFRNGFWTYTSLRFFYIYGLIDKLNLIDCIHIENDVLLYYNINILNDKIDKNFFYIPFDTFKRNIASIIYIPNKYIFKNILDNYDFKKNDMENFENIKNKTGLIKNFPIFPNKFANSKEELFVSENFDIFDMIFDAAAIGQLLGGVDPKNISGNSMGFVNETCVIKYNKYKFITLVIDGIKRPYIIINNNLIQIFNLHIHSKNLIKFM